MLGWAVIASAVILYWALLSLRPKTAREFSVTVVRSSIKVRDEEDQTLIIFDEEEAKGIE